MTRFAPDCTGRTRPASLQAGVVLFIALLALIVLSLGAIALIRAVDADATIAGNLAFKRATVLAADIGLDVARATLASQMSNLDQDAPNVGYYASVANLAGSIVPVAERWTSVACRDLQAAVLASCGNVGTYRLQNVIERLCVSTPVTDPLAQCVAFDPIDDGSKRSGQIVLSGLPRVHFRITTRVRGPRNAESLVQVVLVP
jgi:type IV pilus assembly protein PilX